jgi:shikimate kinase
VANEESTGTTTLPDDVCVVLIGIAGAGKSTLAPILARDLGWRHMDTDRLVEAHYGTPLQALLDAHGNQGLMAREETVVSGLWVKRCVISTGGSVIYSRKAVKQLSRLGFLVYLKVDFATFSRRVGQASGRAFIRPSGQTMRQVYDERHALYAGAADLTVSTDSAEPGETARTIIDRLGALGQRPPKGPG